MNTTVTEGAILFDTLLTNITETPWSQWSDPQYLAKLRRVRLSSKPPLRYLLTKYRMMIVQPIIGIFGVTGNILGLLTIVRCGLKKSSNCLLLGLAISDIMALIGHLNIPYILMVSVRYKLPHRGFRWEFPYTWSKLCFIANNVCWVLDDMGYKMSDAIIVLITVERLVAIFLPLHFSRIVTPKRVWAAMFAALLFWGPSSFTWGFCNIFKETYSRLFDTYYYQAIAEGPVNDMIGYINSSYVIYIDSLFSLCFVASGCVAISIKVGMTMRAQARLKGDSTKGRSTSQTTRTLVAVCSIFCIMQFMKWYKYL